LSGLSVVIINSVTFCYYLIEIPAFEFPKHFSRMREKIIGLHASSKQQPKANVPRLTED